MAELVDKWKLGATMPVNTGALEGFRNLRGTMYAAVSDLGNYALIQDELQEINKILRNVWIKIQINSANGGLTIIHQYDEQGWVFYDESKNKSRRWCDDKACGNIMKVRRFWQKESEEDCHEKYDQGNSEEKPH